MELTILYQDESIVAVHKPAGLLVHRTALDKGETQYAVQILRDQLGKQVHPIHRLDKPTSGVLLFAFEAEKVSSFVEAMQADNARKVYQAIVRGYAPKEGTIDYSLRRELDKFDNRKTAELQTALTLYKTLQHVELPFAVGRYPSARYSLVELEIKTGRKHQARRHMAHIRHPVIGDSRHGDGAHNRFFRETLNINRLMLAATKLEITHPISNTPLTIEAPFENSFQEGLSKLGMH